MVRLFPLLLTTVLLPVAAPAQDTTPPAVQLPAPAPTPVPTAVPTTSFPRDRPFFPGTPTASPTPVPSPTATLTPTPTQTSRPAARATATRTRVPEPVPIPRPSPRASTDVERPSPATPTPSAEPSATPSPASTPPPIETVVLPPGHETAPVWPWFVGGAVVLGLLAIGWAALRRRGEPRTQPVEPVFHPMPLPAARIALAVRPTRAGLNLLSATVDTEVTLSNAGDAPAHDVRAELRLFSLTNGQDAELAAFYDEPIVRPSTPAFTLHPGEERRFRVVAALPHGDIRPITAGGRPMFVPLVALSVRYRDGQVERQAAQAFAVGVERVDSAKLAPLWLDAPARQYEGVAARAHAGVLER